WNVSREEQDNFALASQQKYFAALQAGKWQQEIAGVETGEHISGKGICTTDEHPRQTSQEKLARLKPAFKPGGTVTAGNASGVNDGAAALLLASGEAVKKYR